MVHRDDSPWRVPAMTEVKETFVRTVATGMTETKGIHTSKAEKKKFLKGCPSWGLWEQLCRVSF